MTTPPDNPASALEKIFTLVRETGANSIKGVWTTVLDAEHGTPEFYRRHGEVIALITRLDSFLRCLPEDNPTRSRNIGDVPVWFAAVVPTEDWDAGYGASSKLITEYNVRLLGALGETLSVRSGVVVDSDTHIEQLRQSLSDWRLLLEKTSLPDSLRIEIQQQIEHIEWLLSHVDMLGYEPVVQQSRTLFGMGFSVVKVTGNVAKVATAISSLFQFITSISVHDYGPAMNALAGLTSTAGEVFAIASEQERKAVESGEQKALTEKASDKREIVEAEVVEDPPDSPAPDDDDGAQG